MARARVLHVLSQRPALTGSGVTLDALLRHGTAGGWEAGAVVGVPAGDAVSVGDLPPERLWPVTFGTPEADLPFPVPGMSDVMPYQSSRFSRLTPGEVEAYKRVWRRHLTEVVAQFEPQIIHCNHAWLVAACLGEVAPGVPVVIHGHGTDLRQLALCPHLAPEVRAGVGRHGRLLALHRTQGEEYARELGFPAHRIVVVGAGFREELFHDRGRADQGPPAVTYAGKLSPAKGLPWLLEAWERVSHRRPELRLHVAGSGAGAEADAISSRLAAAGPGVVVHGHLDQNALAQLLRRSAVFVLPSFFEGLPLVLVEALACGCRPVCTALPAVLGELAPVLGDAVRLVPLPRLSGVDQPWPEDLPAFVDHLVEALDAALAAYAQQGPARVDLTAFTWGAVFGRVERVWEELLAGP